MEIYLAIWGLTSAGAYHFLKQYESNKIARQSPSNQNTNFELSSSFFLNPCLFFKPFFVITCTLLGVSVLGGVNLFALSDKDCHRQRLKVGWKCRRKNLNGYLCLMGEKSRGLSTLIVSDMHRAASATSGAGKVNRAAQR